MFCNTAQGVLVGFTFISVSYTYYVHHNVSCINKPVAFAESIYRVFSFHNSCFNDLHVFRYIYMSQKPWFVFSQPNTTLNRSAAIWHFVYFQAFSDRARLALR